MSKDEEKPGEVRKPPVGWGILLVLGPGLVWCGEYIGTGEVILATRTGAVLGFAALWAPMIGVVAKTWIGVAGARYTVCTGEGMIDMMSRTPGPRNWVIWPTFVGQLCAGAVSIAGVASAAGAFSAYFIPLDAKALGWIISLLIIALVWSGRFDVIQKLIYVLILIIVIAVFDVARTTWPGWGTVLSGMFGFHVPELPVWAYEEGQIPSSPWVEILPLIGWSAGGFASQVWYTYWVLGAGYGMAEGRGYGKPFDAERLRTMTAETAQRVKGWCRVLYADAGLACFIGTTVTLAFLISGAAVLRPAEIAPDKSEVAIQLSNIFSAKWGAMGARLFMLAGLAAMISTLIGLFAGWPRLLADCARILFPPVAKTEWKWQFRALLVFYAISNMVFIYSLEFDPVFLVKTGAITDGLLLTPLQALSVGLVLYTVMPRFLSEEARRILKPSPVLAVGLGIAFLLFSYFCFFQVPQVLMK